MDSATDYAIEAEDLGKAYRRYGSPVRRLAEALTLGKFRGHEEVWALRAVNLQLPAGASLGLVGENGAGKSTLLRLFAATTLPTRGRFRVRGRVATLLELGAGFHLDFTGRENIRLNGLLLGLSRRELAVKEAEILEFAEIGDAVDAPVRTYSAGMGMRLGFAIAAAANPDVLLIDEVFAVGDMYFQKKCVDHLLELKRMGRSLVLCSHSLYDIRQMCDQALWLSGGKPAAAGDAVMVTNEYATFQREHIGSADRARTGATASDRAEKQVQLPRLLDARLYRAGGTEEISDAGPGDAMELRIWYENPDPGRTPIHLGLGFLRQDRTLCAGLATHFDGLTVPGRTGCAALEIPELELLSGQFQILVVLFDGSGVHRYQEFVLPENLVVRSHTREVGLFRMRHQWRLLPEDSAPPRPPPPSTSASPTIPATPASLETKERA